MYKYEDEKPKILTDSGQRMFLKIRDRVSSLIEQVGCVRMDCAILNVSGSSWEMMACVDRMVELGEIDEVIYKEKRRGQYRIFEKSWKRV